MQAPLQKWGETALVHASDSGTIMRLSSLALSVARRRSGRVIRHACALPACRRGASALGCCGQRLCLRCRTEMLRASFCCKKYLLQCPFCRKMWRVSKRGVKKMMARTCPSHAKVIPCVLGPPCIAVHTPCPIGHYDCTASTARLLQLGAQERAHAQIDALGRKLDAALAQVAHLRVKNAAGSSAWPTFHPQESLSA